MKSQDAHTGYRAALDRANLEANRAGHGLRSNKARETNESESESLGCENMTKCAKPHRHLV